MTPLMRQVLEATAALNDLGRRATANAIARQIGDLEPVQRHGRGAVKGSWSGQMAINQRILGPLGQLHKQSLVWREEPKNQATEYFLTEAGRTALAEALAEEEA